MKKINSIFLILFLLSCSKEPVLILKSKNSHRITESSYVYEEEQRVGNVNLVKVNRKGDVYLEVIFDSSFAIPKDSKFEVKTMDLLGTKAIQLTKGNSIVNLDFGKDTAQLVNKEPFSNETLESIERFITVLLC